MPLTTKDYPGPGQEKALRLQECEEALVRLRRQMARIRASSDALARLRVDIPIHKGSPNIDTAVDWLEITVQGAEEILGNVLGDEPSP